MGAVLLLLLGACSKEKKALSGIESAYAKGDYAEAVALSKLAVRHGIESADIQYLQGASLVQLGRDFEGYRHFDNVVAVAPEMAKTISEFLLTLSDLDRDQGNSSRSVRRMQKAYEVDPTIDLARRRFAIADLYFEQKQFAAAAREYRRAVEEFPDSPECESAYFNLATAYADAGLLTDATAALMALLEKYPRGDSATEARWRLGNLVYEEAEKQFLLGNYDEVVELATVLVDDSDNRGLVQKTHFLLGEAFEAKGDFENAYVHYREVIQGDRGASGRIVERAREKIAAFQEAGLF